MNRLVVAALLVVGCWGLTDQIPCDAVQIQRATKLECGAADLGFREVTGTIMAFDLTGHANGDNKIDILPDDLTILDYRGRQQVPDQANPRLQLGVWVCDGERLAPVIASLAVGDRVRASGYVFFDPIAPNKQDGEKLVSCYSTIIFGKKPKPDVGYMEIYPTTSIEKLAVEPL